MNNSKLYFLGNKSILSSYYKTAFFCSRKITKDVILKSYDWAKEERKKGSCIISGFHSQIEKDVFEILLKGRQPIIKVLARGIKQRWSFQVKKALEEKRLLIISPFEEKIKYIDNEKAFQRNKLIFNIADEIKIVYLRKNSFLEKLFKEFKNLKKIQIGF